MELPSVSNIFFIIIFILPGYIILNLIRHIGQLKRKLSNSELLYLSLTCSLAIYLVLSFIFNISDFTEMENFLIQPYITSIIIFYSIGSGVTIGVLFRLYRNYRGYTPYDTWASAIGVKRDIDLPWIIVYTQDGQEFKGILNLYGIGKEQKELSLLSPLKILRDDEFYVIEEVNLGDELYFTEKNISRILFLTRDINKI